MAIGIGIATSMRGRCILEGVGGEKREGRVGFFLLVAGRDNARYIYIYIYIYMFIYSFLYTKIPK